MSLIGFGLHGNLGAGGLWRGEGRRPRPADQWEPPSSAAAKPEWQPWRLTIVPPSVAAPRSRREGGVAPQPRGPWHPRLSPSLPGSLFSSSPWPPRAGFTCQRRFRPEQKTRPLTASPGARLPWQRRPRGQAASNHSCWIRLVRALMLGAQTQRHPAGAEPGPAASQERPSLWGPGSACPASWTQVPKEAPEPRPLAPTRQHPLACRPPTRPQLTVYLPRRGPAWPSGEFTCHDGEGKGPKPWPISPETRKQAALLHPLLFRQTDPL